MSRSGIMTYERHEDAQAGAPNVGATLTRAAPILNGFIAKPYSKRAPAGGRRRRVWVSGERHSAEAVQLRPAVARHRRFHPHVVTRPQAVEVVERRTRRIVRQGYRDVAVLRLQHEHATVVIDRPDAAVELHHTAVVVTVAGAILDALLYVHAVRVQRSARVLLHLERDDVASLQRRHRVLLLPVDDDRVLVEKDVAGLTVLRHYLDPLVLRIDLANFRGELSGPVLVPATRHAEDVAERAERVAATAGDRDQESGRQGGQGA